MPGSLDTLRSIAEPSWQGGMHGRLRSPGSCGTRSRSRSPKQVIAELARVMARPLPCLVSLAWHNPAGPHHPPTDVEDPLLNPDAAGAMGGAGLAVRQTLLLNIYVWGHLW